MPRSAIALARFVTAPDPAPPDVPLLFAFTSADARNREAAFEELVRRHGPMVLAVCRRVLGNPDDADDAFQATFLVLARKAGCIQGNLAGWLYAVAVRTARGVRVMRDRRRKHESLALASGGRQHSALSYTGDHDLAVVIDEELAKLPEHYREAIILCELRGLSRKQAAVELGIPEGTLSSRLATAKRKLAARLSARGLATPAALVSLVAPAAVSAALLRSAVCATRGAAGTVASAAASAVVKGMLFDQLKTVALAAGILLSVACGGWAMTGSPGRGTRTAEPTAQTVTDPIAKLVAQLGADEFADREAAQNELRKLGAKAEPVLKAALKSDSSEIRDRAAKVLSAIRTDARDALVKSFDAATGVDPDHPVWKRFKTIAGNDKPARKLFAEIIADSRRLQLLDQAEADPARAGDVYAAAVDRIYTRSRELLDRPNPRLTTGIPRSEELPWPDAAAVIYLGTYPSSKAKVKDGWNREGHLFMISGHAMLTSPAGPAAKRVFAAWLTHRDDALTLEHAFNMAVFSPIPEALPIARKLAADDKSPLKPRLQALRVVAQFGAPADRPLFEALFVDDTPVATFPEKRSGPLPAGATGTVTTQARDAAAGMALLLHGEDPFAHGFWHASSRWAKTGDRPDVGRYELAHFGFYDGVEKLRTDTHAKVKAFLDKQPRLDPKKEEPEPDPEALKLVEQLGATEFADREEAAKKLRKLGMKAEAALKTALHSDNQEIRDRAARVLNEIGKDRLWVVFATVAGEDKVARELFTHIASSPRALAALKAAIDDPTRTDELYRNRTAELMRIAAGHTPVDAKGKATLPTEPDVWAPPAVPLGDIAGWMFLGALQSGKAEWREVTHKDWEGRLSSHVPFLPEDDYTSAKPIAAAYTGELSRPLKKLTAAWLAKRRENDMLRAGFALAMRYDIADAVTAARIVLKEPKPTDVASWNLATAAIFIALHGGKDDLPLLARHGADDRNYQTFLNLPKDFDWVGAIPSVEGRDLFCHVRDAVAVSMCKLAGKKPSDFGFPPFPATKHPSGAPTSLSSATAVGFIAKADRAKAFEKAAEWLKSFETKEEPKKKPDPEVAKLVEQLGSPDFQVREAAEKSLETIGEPALSALRAAVSDAASPEVRKRAADVIRRIERRIEAQVDLRLTGHTSHVNGVAFFPNGEQILTVGDMSYRIWDAKTGKELGRGEQGSEGYDGGGPAAVAPDGKRISVRYFVADPATHKFLFGLEGHTAAMNRIVYARDGSRILTASQDGTIRLWRPDFEKELRRIDAHMGKKLLPGPMVGNFEPGVKLPDRFENRGARDAAFSFDGKRIVSGGDDGTVRVWDAGTGKELHRMSLDKVIVTSVAFLSNSKVVAGGSDGLIRVWDIDTGKELEQYKGHTGWVSAIAVTLDDARVVSTSHDGTARVWDAATGTELRSFRGHTGAVYAVALAPDGRTAVTGGADKTARVWAMPAARR